jgi:hypothetical protein
MWRGNWPGNSDGDSVQDLQEIPGKIAFLENWLSGLA